MPAAVPVSDHHLFDNRRRLVKVLRPPQLPFAAELALSTRVTLRNTIPTLVRVNAFDAASGAQAAVIAGRQTSPKRDAVGARSWRHPESISVFAASALSPAASRAAPFRNHWRIYGTESIHRVLQYVRTHP